MYSSSMICSGELPCFTCSRTIWHSRWQTERADHPHELVIDLGGLHGPSEGLVQMDSLGLTPGESYAMDIFHAERRTEGSTFRVDTNIDCFIPIE